MNEFGNGHVGDVGRVQLQGLPVAFVPTPTIEYRTHRKALRATVEPAAPPSPMPIPSPLPVPLVTGSRVLIWKQDPSVAEIGPRKAYIPSRVVAGPRDARIVNGAPGLAS